MKSIALTTALAAVVATVGAAHGVDLDARLPAYTVVSGVSGQIKAVGSDTMASLMKSWAEGFKALYPGVSIEIESKGSATAPPALVQGVSQVGPMSRGMDSDEVGAFQTKFGYAPSSLPVAVDALAVYVNKDNPLACLTLQQLDWIFSKDHWNSNGGNAEKWGDLGLTGEWAARPIAMFGRNSLSGTYETFKVAVLYKGEFKDEVSQQPDSSSVVRMVANDRSAIGYSGIGYLTDGVRAVPLAASTGAKCYDTSAASAYSGDYPLARYLYLYLNKKGDQPLDPTVAEFIKYVVSKDGQSRTASEGFYPITDATRINALVRLGLSTETN